MMDAEQLRWRQLDWSLLPHTTRKGAMPFLSMGDTVSLDNAVTNSDARPHLVKAYEGLESSGWTLKLEEDYSCKALEWVRERGINLRGFEMEVRSKDNGELLRQSGPVLVELMGYSNGYGEAKGDRDLAEYFADRGKLVAADLDVGHAGWTALTRACDKGYLDIVKALLAAGADKDKGNDFGNTPLIRAALKGHLKVVQVLLKARAKVDTANKQHGDTALILAAHYGLIEVVEALLTAGANKDHADMYGNTALISAAYHSRTQVVEALLKAGADFKKVDTDGETALMIATNCGHTEIVQLLQAAAAAAA